MGKRSIDKEQYFTTPALARSCVDFLHGLFPLDSFDLTVEPSAGGGAFYSLLPAATKVGIDIEPPTSMSDQLIASDFLDWNPEGATEQRKVLTVGNPPFGARGALAIKFIKHAAAFSDVIAFILPRSFNKYTFQNRIPDNFHLVGSFDCDDFQLPNGDLVTVKTVFQVWERRETKRVKVEPKNHHEDFTMRHAHLSRVSLQELKDLRDNYDFTIPQVGANFSPRDVQDVNKGSHWFISASSPQVRKVFENANFDFLADMNIAHTSLSKSDIVRAYEEALST